MRPPLQPSQVQLGIVGGAVVRPVSPNVMTPPEQHVRRGCSKRGLELQAGPVHVRIATETDRVAMRARAPYYIYHNCFCVKYSVINDQKHKILIFKKKSIHPNGRTQFHAYPLAALQNVRTTFARSSTGCHRATTTLFPSGRAVRDMLRRNLSYAQKQKNKNTQKQKNKKNRE